MNGLGRERSGDRRGPGIGLRPRRRRGTAILLAGALVAGVLATGPLPAEATTCPTIAPAEWLGTWVLGTNPASGGVVKFDLSFGATTVGGVMEFATGQGVFAGDDAVTGTRAPNSCDFTADIGGLVTLQGEIASSGVEMSGGWTYHPGSTTVAASGTWQTGQVADSAAGSGLALTTDPDSSGVSAGDPIATGVSSPTPGAITIDEAIATGGSLRGFSLLDTMVRITAPSATAAAPLALTFDLDSSATGGLPPSSVTVYRNGEPVPLCLGAVPPITLDPCVSVAAVLDPPLSGLRFTVLTSEASSWMFGTPNVAPTGLRITTASLPAAHVGQAYSVPLDATGGNPPYKFKKLGKLPKGLKVKKGVIFGVPTEATGTSLVTIQVSDKLKVKKHPAVKHLASKQFSITVN